MARIQGVRRSRRGRPCGKGAAGGVMARSSSRASPGVGHRTRRTALKGQARVHDAAPRGLTDAGRRGLTARRRSQAPARPAAFERAGLVFQVFGTASFQSLWYWVLSVTVWTHRLPPHPRRALRHGAARRAGCRRWRRGWTTLAHIAADRVGGIHDRFGVPIAALAGFALAGALRASASCTGIELAQAAFMLAFPLTVVGYSTLRLALAVRRKGTRGAELRQILARRRLWHQAIAILALLAAALVGLAMHPRDAGLTPARLRRLGALR